MCSLNILFFSFHPFLLLWFQLLFDFNFCLCTLSLSLSLPLSLFSLSLSLSLSLPSLILSSFLLPLTGSIFHVRIHTQQKGLEHALLYSIGVNLPVHRVGQLDRVIVLASPINDINIHAWDLNHVKQFVQLDIGIHMEFCSSCMVVRNQSITLIIDKRFQKECLQFLCHESHISDVPVQENEIWFFPVNHRCVRPESSYLNPFPLPPSYEDSQIYSLVTECETSREGRGEGGSAGGTTGGGGSGISDESQQHGLSSDKQSQTLKVTSQDEQTFTFSSSNCDSDLSGDGIVPPRNITRRNFESAIQAIANPYTNYQPHLFQQRSSSFDSPYQISSRIIITDTGKVQYERNILGSRPQGHGGFHFKRQVPLPPRHTHLRLETQVCYPSERLPSPPPPVKQRQPRLPLTNERRDSDTQVKHTSPMSEKRSSELSDYEDMYNFITQRSVTPQHSPHHYPTSNASEQHQQIGHDYDNLPNVDSVSDTSYPSASRSEQNVMRHSDPYDDVILVNVSQHIQVGSMDAPSQPRDADYHIATLSVAIKDDAANERPQFAEATANQLSKSPSRSPSSLSPKRQQKKPTIVPRKCCKKSNSEPTERPFLVVDDVCANVQPRVARQQSTPKGSEGERSGESGGDGSSSGGVAASDDGEGRREGRGGGGREGGIIEVTVGSSEEEYGRGGGGGGVLGEVYVEGGGGGGGEIEVAVHKLGHSQNPNTLHTSLISQTPSAPPTPKPRSRIHYNMTPAYSTDDVELGGRGTLRVKRRERSISTTHDPIDLSTIYYTDV